VSECVGERKCVCERERASDRAREREREREREMPFVTQVSVSLSVSRYGVAAISRLLKITGLFCTISSLLQGSFAKETYNFKEPTNCSHPISISLSPSLTRSFSPFPRHIYQRVASHMPVGRASQM